MHDLLERGTCHSMHVWSKDSFVESVLHYVCSKGLNSGFRLAHRKLFCPLGNLVGNI